MGQFSVTILAAARSILSGNQQPKPLRWTKSAEDILIRERRALDALDEIRGNR